MKKKGVFYNVLIMKHSIRPLQENDVIALTCSGSTCRAPNHAQLTKNYLQERYHLNAIYTHDTSECLPPKKRAEIFLEYLFNDDIKLIAQLRGGEGCADILPYIHKYAHTIKALSPKWLLGFSDITALLIYFEKHYHWPVIHGPSLLQFALDQVCQHSLNYTMDLLFGRNQTRGLDQLEPLNTAARAHQTFEAKLIGGNLSLVAISIKDIWEIDTADKIIFLEDNNEKAHKVIRNLKYLARIGLFEKAKAIILGDFTCSPIGCDEEEKENNKQTILKTLSSFAAHHDLPVLYTKQFGHGKTNLPLLYSTRYKLHLGEEAKLATILFPF